MAAPLFSVRPLALPGVLLITPQVFSDVRGDSLVTYNVEAFAELGITSHFTQDFVSRSTKNVIRGLHYQRPPYAQDKLVRCTEGEIFDVVVDHDLSSPTFGSHLSVTLTEQEHSMLYVPGKYAHGFCVVSESAVVEYKIAGVYAPEHAFGVRYNDPAFDITWPVASPILSERDTSWDLVSKI